MMPGALIPFGWRALVTKAALTMRPAPSRAIRTAATRAALYASSQAAWIADDLLWPAWRDATFRGPLFVIGHQRSGTTLLHRLLTRGADTRALTLREMLFPSLAAQELSAKARALDASFGGFLRSKLDRAQERWFGPLDALHRMRLGEVEEDEVVLWAIGASGMCATDDPRSVDADSLAFLRHPEQWPEGRAERAFGYYRDCLRKKAFRALTKEIDRAPWLVSKNPAFCQKIPLLLDTFPDARFVLLVRDPREAIPSRLHLVRSIWRHRFPWFHEPSRAQIAAVVDDSAASYLLARRDLAHVSEERNLVVHYEALMADPHGTAGWVRRYFGLAPCAEDRGPARESKKNAPRLLAEFGLDAPSIEERLRDVFEEHGAHWKAREKP